MAEFTKADRAKLRALAEEAYERELGAHLAELDKSFKLWRSGKLLASELSKDIHEFHQHGAREVWSAYQLPRPEMVVNRAIALGILKRKDLPAALLAKLTSGATMTEEAPGAA